MLITIDRPSNRAVTQQIKHARERVGGFSNPSKMPCCSWSIPAALCKTGGKLAKIKGTVCWKCYALRGFYNMPAVKRALSRRFQTLANSQQWESDFITALQGEQYFRWFDSGDLQSLGMLEAINRIALATPNVQHWLPTKEYKIVRQFLKWSAFAPNLTVRLSAYKIDSIQAPFLTGQRSLVFSPDQFPTVQESPGVQSCKAPLQGGQCLDCRACWDRTVETVIYKQH